MSSVLTALFLLWPLIPMSGPNELPMAPLDLSGRTLSRWMQDSLGCTIIVRHPHAAFPDGYFSHYGVKRRVPVRRRIHGKLVSRSELRLVIPPAAFQDNRVLVFVPAGYRTDAPSRLLIFFHGWNARITDPGAITEDLQLRSTVAAARGNPVLIVPQGPVNAPASSFGRLESVAGLTKFLADL